MTGSASVGHVGIADAEKKPVVSQLIASQADVGVVGTRTATYAASSTVHGPVGVGGTAR
jgi:hypothetical protein